MSGREVRTPGTGGVGVGAGLDDSVARNPGRVTIEVGESGAALAMALALRLSHDRGGVRVPFPIDGRTFTVDSR
jgi:hypothetical protein